MTTEGLDAFILCFIFHHIQKWHQVAGDDGLVEEIVKKYSRVEQVWLSMSKIAAPSSLYFEPYLSSKNTHLFDAWKSSKLYLRIQLLQNIKTLPLYHKLRLKLFK